MTEKTVTPKRQTKSKTISNKKYTYAVGRRKRAVAQIRLFEKGKGEIVINGKKGDEYLPDLELKKTIISPLVVVNLNNKVDITVLVRGGGKRGQAEAIRHGIARALEKTNEEFRKVLKVEGFLKRDARRKERKKPGLKRARRAPQWSKR